MRVENNATVEGLEGTRAEFSKTVAESDIYLFAGLTGDLDPNHVDEEYCKETSFGARIAHGALIVGYMSNVSTKALEHFPAPLVSVGYDRIRFIAPVYIGDTIVVEYVIVGTDLEKGRTIADVSVRNQKGETVAVATHIQQIVP